MACFKSFVLLLLSYNILQKPRLIFVGRKPYCHQKSQTTTQWQHAFKNRLADVCLGY